MTHFLFPRRHRSQARLVVATPGKGGRGRGRGRGEGDVDVDVDVDKGGELGLVLEDVEAVVKCGEIECGEVEEEAEVEAEVEVEVGAEMDRVDEG